MKELGKYNLQLFAVWIWMMGERGWEALARVGDWSVWLVRLMGFSISNGILVKQQHSGLSTIT